MALLQPFYEKPWPPALRSAAQALWCWHLNLRRPRLPESADAQAFLQAEAERLIRGDPVQVVPHEVWEAAYQACVRHQLPLALLGRQLQAAWGWISPVRFPDAAALEAFVQDFAGAHGRLLVRLMGVATRFEDTLVDALAAGFFLTDRLARLPRDLAADRLFIPLEDLDRAGVSVELLQRGDGNSAVRRLLWKQVVRAQEALARGRNLVHALPRRYASVLRRAWLEALEVLHTIERRDYDLWRGPIRLSPWQRLHIAYQARFSRVAFRK